MNPKAKVPFTFSFIVPEDQDIIDKLGGERNKIEYVRAAIREKMRRDDGG